MSPQPPSSPDTTFDVLCVGNAIVDVLTQTDDAFLDEWGLVKGTMSLIDADQAARLYGAMGPGVEMSGGSAANTAAGVASFGGRVAFIGKVADDQLGEVFAHDLRSAGVHYEVPPAPAGSAPTARCLVLVTGDAQRTLNTHLGVSSDIAADDIDDDLIAASQVVYCEGYLWDRPAAKAAITHVMDVAASARRTVAFTLSDPFCVDRHRDEFLELVAGRVNVLFANEAEIMSLYGAATFDDAVDQVAGHVDLACLTRSELGSLVVTSDGDRIEVPAHPVDTVVDTTGAGDLFAAGFLVGHARQLPLDQCGRLGSMAAAEVISHVGARPAVPLSQLMA